VISLIIKSPWIDNIDLNHLGGKGKNLALLSKNNIPVPYWFCVSGQAYRNYIDLIQNDINKILQNVDFNDYNNLNKAFHNIKSLISGKELDSKVKQDIAEQIKGLGTDSFFSIRSSCIQEDSMALSYAGLFETYLYVPAPLVLQRIIACWSSVFSDRALAYFHKNNVSVLDVDMAVIVQEMVASHKSGVLFQANPMGRLEETVIVAGYGLGEGIVGNYIQTDTYYYNRITKTQRSVINTKDYKFAFNKSQGAGVEQISIPETDKEKQTLSNEELMKLIDLSNKIDLIYEHYQDIEWAITEKGEVFILQSRPITTIPQGEKSLYDNSNIIENYPGISSVLTYSMTKKMYKNNFIKAFKFIGYSSKFLKNYYRHFSAMIEIIQGRIYYNLSNWYTIMSLLPGGSSILSDYLEEMLGVRNKKEHETKKRNSLTAILLYIKVIIILIGKFLNWNGNFNKYKIEFNSLYKESQKDLENESDLIKLKDIHEKLVDIIPKLFDKICINDFYVMVSTGIAKKLLSGLTAQDPESVLNGLLVGEEGMESVEPVRSLIEMAKRVRASPQLKQAIEKIATQSDLNKLSEKFKDFHVLFLRHLEKYGDRGIKELQLECKSFRQDPQKLISLILNYSDSDMTLEINQEQEMKIRKSSEDKLVQLLKNKYLKRRVVNYIIRKVRFVLKNRESSRLDRSRIYGLFREIYLRIAEHWENFGVLSEKSDIFYLTTEEIIENISNCNIETIHRAILQRKNKWEEFKSYQPVDRMWLNGDISENFIPQEEYVKTDLAGSNLILQGLGCCPGIVSGEAIVLQTPDGNANVSDKILVARSTDPGWIFLIMASKGIIVEKGSLLSHTVIIGRELGKPTIVGVSDATIKIRQNSFITMDGTKGTIKIGKS
jgi:phosphohistidine swiveling domain-containing protein